MLGKINSNWFHSNANRASCGWISPSLRTKVAATGENNPPRWGILNAIFTIPRCATKVVAARVINYEPAQATSACKFRVYATCKSPALCGKQTQSLWTKSKRAGDKPRVPRRADSIQRRARALFPLMRFEWAPAQQERIPPAIHLLQWPVSVILDNGG
jgi:hypothetical protein